MYSTIQFFSLFSFLSKPVAYQQNFLYCFIHAVSEDYSNSTIELRFTPGVGAVSGALSVIDDRIKEMTESVNLVLSVPGGNPRPVCIKSPGTASCTITDNDGRSSHNTWHIVCVVYIIKHFMRGLNRDLRCRLTRYILGVVFLLVTFTVLYL